jgi:hypothetical protein
VEEQDWQQLDGLFFAEVFALARNYSSRVYEATGAAQLIVTPRAKR